MKTILFLFTSFFSFGQVAENQIFVNNESKELKPTLFADLGESCSTPDGMAIDKNGKLFLAVTNLETFNLFGSKILTFDRKNKPSVWFSDLPIHPLTGKVHPMGIEFGSDGNLYIADNQYFAGGKNASRILRIVVENGKPQKAEVLVEGLGFSNGIRLYKNRIYLTDFMTGDSKESAVYSFDLNELNTHSLKLDEANRGNYQIGTFPVGIDGLTLDHDGNLYAGHFINGSITKFEFNENREVKSKEIILQSDEFKCADGMFYDKTRNCIFLANLSNNSIHMLDLESNSLNLLWVNDDNNGATGWLDNPCETIVYKKKLIVVNFDTFTGDKNSEVDKYKTISAFKLSKKK